MLFFFHSSKIIPLYINVDDKSDRHCKTQKLHLARREMNSKNNIIDDVTHSTINYVNILAIYKK